MKPPAPNLPVPVLAPVSAAPNGAAGADLSEAQLHTACAKHLDAVLSPEVIWTSIGHGGGGAIRGRKLKAMGVKKGVPDILICWDAGGVPGILWLELKSAKGRATPEQTAFFIRAQDMGHLAYFCRSLADVESILQRWRVPVRISRK